MSNTNTEVNQIENTKDWVTPELKKISIEQITANNNVGTSNDGMPAKS